MAAQPDSLAADSVDITHCDTTVLQGGTRTHSPASGLWHIHSPLVRAHTSVPPPPAMLLSARSTTVADHHVAFYHATIGSPALSTWYAAIVDVGFLTTAWPALTSAQVRRQPSTLFCSHDPRPP